LNIVCVCLSHTNFILVRSKVQEDRRNAEHAFQEEIKLIQQEKKLLQAAALGAEARDNVWSQKVSEALLSQVREKDGTQSLTMVVFVNVEAKAQKGTNSHRFDPDSL
jgi:hypothetical protein